MNQVDLLRAKQLSKQLAPYGKLKPKETVKPKKRGLAFPYKALEVSPDTTASKIAAQRASEAAQSAAKLAEAIPLLIKRIEASEKISQSIADEAARQKVLPPEKIEVEKTIETIVEKTIEQQPFEVNEEMVKQIVQMMHKLPEKDKLEVSQGIRNAQSFIYKGTKYGMAEMMHGGSSSSSTGGYQTPLTGAVNGVNQVFTWTTAPQVIVVDQGRPMQKVSSDGTVNWTGTTTTTLTIAPNFDIFASA